jgi:ATP-binding protein involved in chromosome partitioning
VQEAILEALSTVIDPELRIPLTELDMVGAISISPDGIADVEIKLTITGCPAARRIESESKQAVEKVAGIASVNITLSVMTPAERDALKSKLRGGKPLKHNPFDKDTLTNIFLLALAKAVLENPPSPPTLQFLWPPKVFALD